MTVYHSAPRWLLPLLLALVVAACGLLPGAGLVVHVDNRSDRPVRVLIASGARFDPGPARGRVTPEIVGPRTAQDATLVLPGDRDWGVWVDTGDGPNLYFLASDFPIGATGRAPFTLIVDSHYGVGVDIPEEVHGWLGQ